MANTFIKIASTTVGSGGAATISFSSIPSTYTDLIVKLSARSTSSSGSVWNYVEVRPNGSTSSISFRQFFGNGSSAASGSGSFALAAYATDSSATSNTFGNSETTITNYAGSNYKSMLADAVSENNGTSAIAQLSGTLWSNTAAINSLTLALGTGNFAEHSTATLYGISNA